MCFLGLVNLYALRVNMSVAMVCMINQTTTISTSEFNDTKEVNEQCLRENINSTGGQAEVGIFNNVDTQKIFKGERLKLVILHPLSTTQGPWSPD